MESANLLEPRLTRARLGAGGLIALAAAVGCDQPLPSEQRHDRIAWQVAGRGWGITPASDSATVFFGGFDHELLAVEKSTGKLRWRRRVMDGGGYTLGWNVVRVGSTVILPDLDLYAFGADSGEFRWTFQPDDLDEVGTDYITADLSTVFAGSFRGKVYAIDVATGNQKWSVQLPGDSNVRAFGPVVEGGTVYVGIKRLWGNTTNGGLAALDASTGAIRWIREFSPEVVGQGAGCFGRASVMSDKVVVGAEDGRIYGLDRNDGSIIWVAPRVHQLPPAPSGGFNDRRPLTAVGGVIVAGSSTGIVVGLDASSGTERWRIHPNPGSIINDPATDGQNAYVFFGGGEVVAIEGLTGALRWRAGIRAASPGQFYQPAADARYVYAAGVDGFYALRKD